MCDSLERSVLRRMRPLFGTFVEIGVQDGSRALSSSDAAFAVLRQVHDALSFQDPCSELSQINCHPRRAMHLSPIMRGILRLAHGMCRMSCGLFNPTVGGALVERGKLPNHDGQRFLPVGTLDDLDLDDSTIRLRRPVRITLDGIAKGYGVDLAIGELRRNGVRAGWINAGGDIRAFGPVSLPVARHCIDGTLQPLGYLQDAAIATSMAPSVHDDSYPAFIVRDTGDCTAPGLWSVIADRAWRADALTKVAATAPVELQSELVARLGGKLMPAPHS